MKTVFDHEKLTVYQKSLQFIVWLQKILERIPKKYSVNDQLDRSSTSIPLNIAEGNGKYSKKDKCRHFDIARGSALESAGALDVLVKKGLLKEEEILEGKEMLFEIVSMLVGLIKVHSDNLNSKQKRDYEKRAE
jgi:four helix bundle protein